MLLTLGSCKSTDETTWDNRPYRFRATPGPAEWETQYSFSRGGLSIRANGEMSDSIAIVNFHVQNHGETRVSFSESMFTIRGGEPPKAFAVELRNHSDDKSTKLTVLARDEIRFSVRSRNPLTLSDGSLVLAVRGVRDDSGDGGYDFDLFGMPVPGEESGAVGTQKPLPNDSDGRREIRDSNLIETPTNKKP